MELIHILVFSLLAIPYQLLNAGWRRWAILLMSLVALGWFFSESTTDTTFLLIIATLGLVSIVWMLIVQEWKFEDYISLFLLAGMGFAAVIFFWQPVYLAGFSLLLVSIAALSGSAIFPNVRSKTTATMFVVGLIVVLFVLKFEPTALVSQQLTARHAITGVGTTPLIWLGISYLAFRLIGVLLDYQAGRLRLEDQSLRGFVSYALFFPAYTAGPIDRADRFSKDWASLHTDWADLSEGVSRIMVGVLKKFVIADTLALASLNATLAEQTTHAAGLWVMLYLYTFQIFFDFSGYSDVAIGIGRLYGIKLPENFDRPYLQPNIQVFWQRWHMTLSTWFRVYYFNPLSRTLIRSKTKFPQWVNIMIAQVTTMLLIGLWHGVTLNFVFWGLWHGVGLYVFKLISDNTRTWHRRVTQKLWVKHLFYGLSVFLTFHFVLLGWIFFALPELSMSLSIFQRLFGI